MTVLSVPAGATVFIDDQAIGVTPWTGEILPGTHRVRFRLDGYVEADQLFELPAHRAIDVSATLTPEPAAPGRATAPAPTAEPASARPEAERKSGGGVSAWTWTAFGVSAAALGTALVFEQLRAGSEEDVKSEPTRVARLEAYDQMQSRRTTARVLGGVGAAAAVAGGVLLYLDLSRGGAPARETVSARGPVIPRRPAPKLGLWAGCDRAACGAGLGGDF